MSKVKRISPLVILTVLGIVIGGAIAGFYWTSQQFTFEWNVVAVLGAKVTDASLNQLAMDTAFADITVLTDFCGTPPNYVLYLIVDWETTNLIEFYAKIDATTPGSSSVTCTATLVKTIPNQGMVKLLGSVPTNGVGFSLANDGNLDWMKETDPSEEYHLLQLEFTFTKDNMLPPGDYSIPLTISIGDTIS